MAFTTEAAKSFRPELRADARQAWLTHIADYNVSPPLLQLERPVIFPDPDQAAVRLSTQYSGTRINGTTFKGRAERLGWQRGSVCDAGSIPFYRKCFPGAGADVLLELDGMYIGIDIYSEIELKRFGFVKTGTVKIGSYVYNEPTDEKDPRLVPFAEVPPIVFSETLGDLAKIAGSKDIASEEGAR